MPCLIPFVLIATARQNVAPSSFGDLVSFDAKRADRSASWCGMDAVGDETTKASALEAVEQALAEYPDKPLRKRLRNVFVVNRLWTAKSYFGGTVSDDRRSILVAVGDGKNREWIESAVHHEIAHLLMDSSGKAFPRKEWLAVNPERHVYPADRLGVDDLLSGFGDKTYDETLQEQGFMNRYGSANVSEDWATFGETLFSKKTDFLDAALRHKRVEAKLLIASRFYRKSFPGLWPDVEEQKPPLGSEDASRGEAWQEPVRRRENRIMTRLPSSL